MKNIRLTELLVLLALLALLGCSHDAKRANPLDPELTPSVTLTAVMDSTSGVVTLSWTPYSGDTRFASYQVLRNVADRIQVDTLAAITAAEQTTYTDASLTANTVYEYLILVVNDEGFAASSERSRVSGFSVRAVTLLAAAGDPSIGAIGITWTQYRDPGFESYQLFRRVVGTDVPLLLSDMSSVTDTTFTDTTARHGVNYIYRVEAQTSSGSLSSTGIDAVLTFPAVTIRSAEFDASSATATLEWTTYSGARFSHYRVERGAGETGFQPLTTYEDVGDTSFEDTGLRGNTEYTYRIITVTAAAEEINSNEAVGAFHSLAHSWTSRASPLYGESDGVSGLEIFVGAQAGWLVWYDSEGSPVKEERIDLIVPTTFGEPRSAASTLTRNGLRLISMTLRPRYVGDGDGSVSILGRGTRGPQTTLEALAGLDFTAPLQELSFFHLGFGGEITRLIKDLEFLAGETVIRESFADLPVTVGGSLDPDALPE